MSTGRNDPCSCGSGRKAKHCCLAANRSAAPAASIALPMAEGMKPQSVPLAQAVLIAQSRQQSGDMAGAESVYRMILAVEPDHGDSLFFLGLLRHQVGKSAEAISLMRLAAQKHPKVFKYHFNLGVVFEETLDFPASLDAYRRAHALDPQAITWGNIGRLLMMAGELDEAAQCLRRAIQLHPRERSATTHNTLANTLRLQGKLAEALEHYAISLSIEPDAADVRSNYLYVHNCLAEQNLSAIFQAHREFGARCDRPMPPAARVGGGTPGRLRVGYVSPDFRQHSVAHFIEPVLAAHDRERFEVFCYANNTVSDDTTRRLKALVPQWRLIHGRDDAEVAQLIRADGIDILVDLAGHTAKNRLPLFGLKPAPVQVTWLGYPNTTGMTTMDFRITDRFADPPGESDSLHTERLYRMPECFLCFLPPAPSPDVGPLPALHRGFVTFASFNNFAKITPQVIAAWARLLQRVPGSRLAMKNISMDAAHVREHLRTALARAGIEAARLELLSPSATPMEHLERYNAVDIGLDPFPYNGTTTTCDALWMGVPVVALEGRSHVGRVGVSLLNNAGLAQLVARDGDDYVEIAARLAGDLPRLASLRGALRERLRASPLMDAPRFTRHLEAAYADMWRAQRAEAA